LFWFAFLLWPRILNISSYIYCLFVFLLLRIVCSVHLPIYSVSCWLWEISFLTSQYILVISSLSDAQLTKIFSHSIGCLLQSGDYFLCCAEAF
jgi:hypothetical protein